MPAQTKTEYPIKVKYRDLQLADAVKLSEQPYGWATVKQVTEDAVTFFKPYVHTENFKYTGGVICLIGIEEFRVCRDSDTEIEVWDRKEWK